MSKKNVFAGTGISSDDDPYKAGQEAVEIAAHSENFILRRRKISFIF